MTEIINSILKNVVGSIQRQQREKETIEKTWKAATEKQLRTHTKAYCFKKSLLYVYAENSAWLHELRMKKPKIEQKINKISGNKIKGIRVKVGDIHE